MQSDRTLRRRFLIAIVLIGLPWFVVSADEAEQKGLATAEEMVRRDTGWIDARADLLMVLRNRTGKESRRSIRVRWLEVTGDGDKLLILFDSPRDLRGTALLSHTHALKPDDQWLYIHAIKRVKRIASANKSGPFVGSEFAYEDLSSQEVVKYTYKWLRDELLDGIETIVIERYPAYQHSGYTRQVVWIDARILKPIKIEYFDRKNALLKTFTSRGYKRYSDRFWRAHRMEMNNHQTGKSTLLIWSNFRFKTGLTNREFDRGFLRRAR